LVRIKRRRGHQKELATGNEGSLGIQGIELSKGGLGYALLAFS